jgi:acyl-coenzyme A thioesterase PaaI-like protein
MSHLLAILQAHGRTQFVEHLIRTQPIVWSIRPHLMELRDGFAQLNVPANEKNADGTGTLCDGALCAVADMAGSLMMNASVPHGARWSKRSMAITYVAAARHEVFATVDGSSISWAQAAAQVIHVTLKNPVGEIVCTAEMTVDITLA